MIHSNDLSGGKKPHGDGDDAPEVFAEEAPAVLQKPQVTEHPIPMTDEHDNLVVPQIEDSPPAGSYPQPPQLGKGDASTPGEVGDKLPPKMVTSQKKPASPSAPLPPLVPQPQGAQPTTDGLPPLPPLPTVSQPQPTPPSGGGKQPPVPGRPAGAFTPQPQPLPPEQKKELEKKAKQMVKDLDAMRPKGGGGGSIPPRQKGKGAGLKYTVAGLLLMVVGAGTFFGIRLLQTEQAADIRQQAGYSRFGNYSDSGIKAAGCTDSSKTCCNSPFCCDGNGCTVKNSTCFAQRYHCDNRNVGPQGCQDRPELFNVSGTTIRFNKDCGLEQIDVSCNDGSGGWASYWHDQDCTGPTQPPPPPTATPTPSRQNYCDSLTIQPNSLLPGQSTTLTSVSNTSLNNYWYAFYNLDNPYPAGDPRPICVPAGVGDNSTYKDSCPEGYYHLHYKDTRTEMRTTGTRTLTYNQAFVRDYNLNASGQEMGMASRVSVSAYMSLNDGPSSLIHAACVKWLVQATAPTPTPSRTPTPTRTPTPVPTSPPGVTPSLTPRPTATSTPIPLACMELNYTPAPPVLGATIDLTCVGAPLDRVERAEFQYRINSGTYTPITNVTNLTAQLFIGDPGTYAVRCRVCDGQTCTTWQTL